MSTTSSNNSNSPVVPSAHTLALAFFLVFLFFAQGYSQPIPAALSMQVAIRIHYWAASTLLPITLALGICYGWMIYPAHSRSYSAAGKKPLVKHHLPSSSGQSAFDNACDAAFGMAYGDFVAGIEARLLMKKSRSSRRRSSRQQAQVIELAGNESTEAVFGSFIGEGIGRTLPYDGFPVRSTDGLDYPTYTPPAIQILAGTDSTLAVFGSFASEDTAPTVLGDASQGKSADRLLCMPYEAPSSPLPLVLSENESIMAVFGSVVSEADVQETASAIAGDCATGHSSDRVRDDKQASPVITERVTRTTRKVHFAEPIVEDFPESAMATSSSAFLDKYFGADAMMEFEDFIESFSVAAEEDREPVPSFCATTYRATRLPGYYEREAAGPSRLAYPDPRSVYFGSHTGNRRRSTVRVHKSKQPVAREEGRRQSCTPVLPEKPVAKRPVIVATKPTLDKVDSGSSDNTSESDDDVNLSHDLSHHFLPGVCGRFNADIAELLAGLSREED